MTEKPKKLKINPFSLAKYLYERGVEDIAVIQKLIYLTYLEILEKENILLEFDEDFQAWPGGSILEKVFLSMLKDWKKHGDYKKLFSKVPCLDKMDGLTTDNKEKITKHCEKWVKHYQELERKKKWYRLSEISKNQPWIIARSKVDNYLDHERIEVSDIINFVQQGRNSSRKQLEV